MGSIMGDEGSEQSGAWHKKTLQEIMGSHNARNKKSYGFVNFYFIFEHTKTFCWVGFAGKMPASNIRYNLLYY